MILRERLEQILQTYRMTYAWTDTSLPPGLLDDLMEWAQGQIAAQPQVTPAYWCDHLLWTWYGNKIDKSGQGYWGYKNKSLYGENIAQEWQVCPVCVAKRPQDV